jgi:hypothetical protein
VLTEQQQRGKKSLMKRQKEGELVIGETYKSGKKTVLGTKDLVRKMEPHIEKDEIVTRERVEKAEEKMSGCAMIMARVLRLGEDHNHGDRVASAMRSECSKIPPIDGMLKDHKKVPDVPVRPVCKSRESPNGILSDLWSDLVEKILDDPDDEENGETECSSTEEMCHDIKKTE